ncbi:related to alcohol oxidase [Cephalotrichum gorgonifer]|uniref:Related to alcohol oxidase n=1 Tax=Cephalotrichum gorgonifer TaxID=2041049 RepID=A0AAE8SWP4_9PEZI|nr:related to alcohol oxidase [Cephalotrichum gorgonifer]
MRSAALGFAAVLTSLLPAVSGTPHGLRGARIHQRAADIAEEYDYIIVGAGTAGLTVADRLSADGSSTVLVIEYCHVVSDEVIRAGGGRSFADPGISYNITSVPQPFMNNRTQAVRIGCCVGGSSAINGMVAVRGTRSEYDGWAELGGEGSTWGWDGVLPYFKKGMHFTPPKPEIAEAFNITWDPDAWGMEEDTQVYASFPDYQDPGVIPMYNAMKKMPNIDVPLDGAGGNNGLFWFPSSLDPETYWRSYARTGHYDNIVDERDNFDVITRHKVQRVILDEDKVATGVEFTARDLEEGEEEAPVQSVRARKEVIISAGTVHTPQILQLSGIGPRELLEEAGIEVLVDIPGVGQNFQDHAYLSVSYMWTNGTPVAPSVPANGDPSHRSSPNLGAWIGLPTMTDDFEALAARYEAQEPSEHLPEGTHPYVLAGYADFQKLHASLLRSKNTNILWLPVNSRPGGIVMSMHIVSHGTINIDPANPTGEPIVDYRALSNPIDMDIMVENIRYMRKYMGSPELEAYGPMETIPGIEVEGEGLEDWIRSVIIPTNFHPVATAAKKPLEKGGVVDEELLVHGVKRLRVVDASIMPMVPGANTQQPVYMVAEKAVDFIKARNAAGESEEELPEPPEGAQVEPPPDPESTVPGEPGPGPGPIEPPEEKSPGDIEPVDDGE